MDSEWVSDWFSAFSEDEKNVVIAAIAAFPAWLANSIVEADLSYAEIAEFILRFFS